MKGSLVKISTKPLHINTPDWWKCAATFHMQSFKPSQKKLEGHSESAERIYSSMICKSARAITIYYLYLFPKLLDLIMLKHYFCLAGASSCQLCIYNVL